VSLTVTGDGAEKDFDAIVEEEEEEEEEEEQLQEQDQEEFIQRRRQLYRRRHHRHGAGVCTHASTSAATLHGKCSVQHG